MKYNPGETRVLGRASGKAGAREDVPVAGDVRTGAQVVGVAEFLDQRKRGACLVLDVRTPAEYAAVHLAGSVLLPLDRLSPETLEVAGALGTASGNSAVGLDKPIYVVCQSGGRAGRAVKQLREWGVMESWVVEGGMDGCVAAGVEVVRGASRVLPLMRQVQLVVGTITALGAGLALWKDGRFAWIPFLTGLGLFYAGLSGTCGLALLLGRMPWNQAGNQSCGLPPAADGKTGDSCGVGQFGKGVGQ